MRNKLKLIGIVVLASVIGLVAVNFGFLKYQEYQQKNNIATLNYSWNQEESQSTPEPSPSEKDEEGLEENKQEEIKQPEPPVTDTKNDKKPEDEYKPGPIILPSQPLNNNKDTSQNNGTSVKDDVVKENPPGQEKAPEQSPETPATPSTNKPSSNQNSPEKKPDSGSAGSSEEQQAYTPPPQNSTPAVTPQSSKGLSFGESLQYTKSGQPALGSVQSIREYPIIADGSPYEGTIHPASNLSQADIDRLTGYKYTNIVESNDIVEQPSGTYDQDASFKRVVDGYLENMGPHIQRKLKTAEWEFTPAPTASYSANFTPLYGSTIIRGMLKVRYNSSDNPFKLEPNVWYQGDAEIGLETTFIFSNDPQDRTPRRILASFVILSGWGKI